MKFTDNFNGPMGPEWKEITTKRPRLFFNGRRVYRWMPMWFVHLRQWISDRVYDKRG